MKVICKSNSGGDLPGDRCKQYRTSRADELIFGSTYIVYGQCIFLDCLMYLIDPIDQEGLRHPGWYPADWFDVMENSIPASWVFTYNNHPKGRKAIAIWGYPELATDDAHYIGLIERETKDFRIFLRRADEIERESD